MYVECYSMEVPTVVSLCVKVEDDAAYSKDFEERREKVAKELRRRFAMVIEDALAAVLSGGKYQPLDSAIDRAMCTASLHAVTEISELREIK